MRTGGGKQVVSKSTRQSRFRGCFFTFCFVSSCDRPTVWAHCPPLGGNLDWLTRTARGGNFLWTFVLCVLGFFFYFAIQFPHTRRVKAEGYKELTAMEKGETLWLLTSSSSSSSSSWSSRYLSGGLRVYVGRLHCSLHRGRLFDWRPQALSPFARANPPALVVQNPIKFYWYMNFKKITKASRCQKHSNPFYCARLWSPLITTTTRAVALLAALDEKKSDIYTPLKSCS